MAAPSVSVLRQRIASALAIGLGSGARESTNHPELFPRDAASVQHLAFAVSVTETSLLDGRRRMRTQGGASDGTEGAFSESTIRIRWAYRLRIGSTVADMDAATDTEQAVFAALADTDGSGFGPLIPQRIQRQAALTDEGVEFQITTIEMTCQHRYQLQ